jgi:hypothetical protein
MGIAYGLPQKQSKEAHKFPSQADINCLHRRGSHTFVAGRKGFSKISLRFLRNFERGLLTDYRRSSPKRLTNFQAKLASTVCTGGDHTPSWQGKNLSGNAAQEELRIFEREKKNLKELCTTSSLQYCLWHRCQKWLDKARKAFNVTVGTFARLFQ